MSKQVSTRTLLADIRKKRGVAVAELAHQIGVSRQTIYAIEDGSYIPNTTIALNLARFLEVRVEDIFSLAEADADSDKPIRAEILGGHSEGIAAGDLVRLGRVHERLVAVPMPASHIYLPPADAAVQKSFGRTVSVRPFVEPDYEKRLLLAGCDPALSLLTDILAFSGLELITIPCASRSALEWLKHGFVHAAGSHLLDHASGEYNLPLVRRIFPKGSVRVVTFATWEQGLVVQPGNPKHITSVADLRRKDLTIINRETGSGSRDLLDTRLRLIGITKEQVRGYDNLAAGHLPAAHAVLTGKADCCIATQSASRRFGLHFIPLASERFDLVLTQASIELPAAKALLDVLNQSQLRKRLQMIAGYDTQQTGQVQL